MVRKPTPLLLLCLGRRWVWLLLVAAVMAIVLQRAKRSAQAATHRQALDRIIARQGLRLAPQERVVWRPGQQPWQHDTAFFLAHRPGAKADLYRADLRLRRQGSVAGLSALTNLTRTPSADELGLSQAGNTLLHAARVQRRIDSLTLLDLKGEPSSWTRGWPWLQRTQHAITNLQHTGSLRGIGRHRYNLRQPVESLSVRSAGSVFHLQAASMQITLDPRLDAPAVDRRWLEPRPFQPAPPSTVTWVVDSVRQLSWVGPEPIEWLEHRVFALTDAWQRLRHRWHRTPDTAAAVEAIRSAPHVHAPPANPSVLLPEPPRHLQPMLQPALRGEGRWLPFDDDAFVRTYPGAPPPFLQTFLRCDPQRPFTQVYVTLWDARQLQLSIMTGTAEPESATGETGAGMVPREADAMRNLVAGFNGGFQALHGEFGMQSEGRVYLPPKPWAATVAVFADGRVGMGSWPGPSEPSPTYDAAAAMRQIPADMVAFRQNLTSVVEDGVYNPWQRWWWGAAPLQAQEQTFIDRSGLCLRDDGRMAYFWGQSLGPEALGQAMLASQCVRGMHLDMNIRHTGFEFYKVMPPGDTPPPLQRPLLDWEWQGPVPGMPGWQARARKAVKSMQPMIFPRYLQRDRRDFFYLSLRPTLPGPPLVLADGGEVAFVALGAANAWPPRLAEATLGDGKAASRIVRLDARHALPQPVDSADCPSQPCGQQTLVAWLARRPGHAAAERTLPEPSQTLYAQRQLVGWRYGIGMPPAGALPLLAGDAVREARGEQLAVGIDNDGFLVFVERAANDAEPISTRLQQARIANAMLLRGMRLHRADGTHPPPASITLGFVANQRPVTEAMFRDNKPQPYRVWARLQDSRVRYFRQDPPRFRR